MLIKVSSELKSFRFALFSFSDITALKLDKGLALQDILADVHPYILRRK